MFKLFSRRKATARPSAPQLSRFERQAQETPGLPPGPLAYAVYDDMQTDAMVQTALTIKRHGVVAAGYRIEPGGTSDDARRRADFVERAFTRMKGSPLTILGNAMDAFAKGWSLQEMVYEEESGQIWLRSVEPKDPSLFGLEIDGDGSVTRLKLALPGEPEVSLVRERFVLYAYRAGYRRPRGRSDLDAAYPHWRAKRQLLASWRRHLERFASPVVLGRYGSGLAEDDRAATARYLESLDEYSALVLPQEVEISTLGGSREASTGFMDALDFHNREIARCILGQTLTTDEGRRVGSLALGKVHLQVLMLQLAAIRRELADNVMTEQVIRPLVELKFGPGPVPRFEFDEVQAEAFATGRVE